MKKILFIALSFGIVLFSACDPKKGDAAKTVEPTNEFSTLVHEINAEVAKNYPSYAFYEASAKLSNVDSLAQKGFIEPETMMLAYGNVEGMSSLIVTVDSTFKLNFNEVAEPWLEDMFMTPYVPMTLDLAIQILQSEIDIAMQPGAPVVLRHQLWYCEPEPRFFIGSITSLNTVNVYTGEINQPLNHPTKEWVEANKALFRNQLEDVEASVEEEEVEE